MSIASHLANVTQCIALTTLTARWMLQRTCFANASSLKSLALQVLSLNLHHHPTRLCQEPNASAESPVYSGYSGSNLPTLLVLHPVDDIRDYELY